MLKYLNKPSSLLVIIIAFFAYKLWLSEAVPLLANQRATYDGLLFQKIAQNIIGGNWLGEYNRVVLTKGPGYPLWIAFIWALSLPLRVANELLYFFAVFIFYRLLVNINLLNLVSVFAIILLLFNPATLNNWYWGGFIRQNIYFSLCAISIFSLFIAFYRTCYSDRIALGWTFLSGLALGYAWITREETMWILPAFIWVFAYSLFVGDRSLRGQSRKVALIGVPAAILLLMVTLISHMNYKHYNFYGVTEFKSEEFTRAWNAVAGVRNQSWKQYWPMSAITLKEISEYSGAMREVEKFLRKKDEKGNEMLSHKWHGAMAHWSFRHAVAKAGYYKTDFAETGKYYNRLANEIIQACNDGNLDCKPELFGMVHWDSSYNDQIVPKFIEVVQSLIKFRGHEIEMRFENLKGNKSYNKTIESLAHRVGGYPMKEGEVEFYPSYQLKQLTFKTSVLQSLISLYRQYSGWLFVISMGVFVLYLFWVKDAKSTKQTVGLIVSTLLGSLFVISSINVMLAITAYNSYVRILLTATPYYIAIVSLVFILLPKFFYGKKHAE